MWEASKIVKKQAVVEANTRCKRYDYKKELI